jgi:putative ABC transport system substrate-binding protein
LPEVRRVRRGGLIGCGGSDVALYRRGAYFVDMILKGAKPGYLPIEQASVFDLAINTRTAKALGVAIPETILLRADERIE